MRWERLVLLAVVLVILGASPVVGFLLWERGSEPTFVDNLVWIPIVVGKPEQEAVAAIKAAGLKPEIRYERRLGLRSNGRVAGQIQPSRPFTSKGRSIVLIVARR